MTQTSSGTPERIHIRALKGTGQILSGLTIKVILVSNLVTYGGYCFVRDAVPWFTGQGRAGLNSVDAMHDAVLGGTSGIAPFVHQNQIPR